MFIKKIPIVVCGIVLAYWRANFMTIKARSIIFKDVLISTDFDTIKNIVGY